MADSDDGTDLIGYLDTIDHQPVTDQAHALYEFGEAASEVHRAIWDLYRAESILSERSDLKASKIKLSALRRIRANLEALESARLEVDRIRALIL